MNIIIFKIVRNELKEFFKEKEIKNNHLFDTAPFSNEDFKILFKNDKIIKEDFLGNRDFYFFIKEIAKLMK